MSNLRGLSYFDIFEENALYRGDSPAIHYNDKNITYAELFRQTSSFASGLEHLNLSAGSRIAVLCKNHPVFFHLFGAASALNLVLVLINRRLSQEELSHIIDDTTPTVIFCDSEMAAQAKALAKSSSCIKHCITVDKNNEFSSLYNADSLSCARQGNADDPYIIIHTAAVQGKPRGAALSQDNLILANHQIIQAFNLNCEKAYLNILPLFHVMGVNLGLTLLQAGGKNIIQEKFEGLKDIDTAMKTAKVEVLGLLKQSVRPEFLNRIDDIIIFKALSKETLIKIVAVLFDELQDRLKEKNIKIRTTKQVQAFLVDKGYEPKKGARPLKRAIQHYFEDKLADKLLEQNLKTNLDVSATLKKGAISFNIKPL